MSQVSKFFGALSTVVLVVVLFSAGAYASPELSISKTVSPSTIEQGQLAAITFDLNGTGTPLVTRAAIDTVLAFDRSISMADYAICTDYNTILGACVAGTTNLTISKQAASEFIDNLNSERDKVALVSFSSSARIDSNLTNDFMLVKTKIDSFSANGSTAIGDALNKATSTISSSSNVKILILLTDGIANVPMPHSAANNYTLEQAQIAKDNGAIVYTIGLGPDVRPELLTQIASDSNKYYFSPTASDLNAIFTSIAHEINTLAASNIVITDVLPRGVDLNLASLPSGCSAVTNTDNLQTTVTCTVPSISIGNQQVVSFEIIPRDSNLTYVNEDTNITYDDYNSTPRTIVFSDLDQPVVLIQNAAPIIEPVTPKSVSENQLLTFTITATDAGNDSISISASSLPLGATFTDNNNGTGTFSWTPNSVQGGLEYNVNFSAMDGLGAVSTEVVVTISVIETDPPVLTLPSDFNVEANTTGGAVVTFTASATDSDTNLTGIEVSCTPSSGSTFILGATVVNCSATSSHSLSKSSSFSVTVADTTAPSITAPANITVEATGFLTTISFGAPIVSDFADSNVLVTQNAPTSFQIGVTEITWVATDDFNNSNSTVQTVTVVDTTAPSISITSPLNNSIVRGIVEISANAFDLVGIDRIEFFINNILTGIVTGSPGLFNWDTTNLTDGLYNVKAVAFDDANNSASADINLTVANPPVMNSFTATVNGSNVLLSFSASDVNNSVSYYEVKMGDNNWITPVLGSTYEFTGLANGTYTFYARAVDNASNTSTDSNVLATVNVVVTPPTGGGGSGGGPSYTPPVRPVDRNIPIVVPVVSTTPRVPNTNLPSNNIPAPVEGEETDMNVNTLPPVRENAPIAPTGLFGLGANGNLLAFLIALLAIAAVLGYIVVSRRKNKGWFSQ